MTDAISRSVLIDTVEGIDWHHVNQNGKLVPGSCSEYESYVRFDRVISAIENAPALDVAPVVHARWIPIKLYGGDHAIKCSACNYCDNPSKVLGRYCWQCGARMDGDAHG